MKCKLVYGTIVGRSKPVYPPKKKVKTQCWWVLGDVFILR